MLYFIYFCNINKVYSYLYKLTFVDESQTKCIQYQEEINKLQKQIEKYQIDFELKEKVINESKHFNFIILIILNCYFYI